MCAHVSTYAPETPPEKDRVCASPKVGPPTWRSVTSTEVKVLADTHVAPPLRRWLLRLGLAVVVAIAIGYAPGQLLDRDPRAAKLEAQLEDARTEARKLAA